jgi:hypothetical protein
MTFLLIIGLGLWICSFASKSKPKTGKARAKGGVKTSGQKKEKPIARKYIPSPGFCLAPKDRKRFGESLYRQCLVMEDGGVIYNPRANGRHLVLWNFDIHFYAAEGWSLYWHRAAESQNIGIRLPDQETLYRACMNDFAGAEKQRRMISMQPLDVGKLDENAS